MLPRDRLILVQILELIAKLELEHPETAYVVQRAARLLGEGRDREAIDALRSATSHGQAVAATAWLIELYLLPQT